METALGLGSVFALFVVTCGAVAVVHRALRPARRDEGSISVALRDLEPRTGRQRFSVRLFEIALLSSAWSVGGVFVALWVSLAPTNQKTLPTLAAGGLLVALLAVTWWAWRRGSFTESVPRPSLDAGGLPETVSARGRPNG